MKGQRRLPQADGDDVLGGEHDAEGDGGVNEGVALGLHKRRVHQDHGAGGAVFVLHLDAASLLFVEGGAHKVGVHMELGAHTPDLLLVGVAQVDPRAGADLILLQHAATVAEVNRDHNFTPAFFLAAHKARPAQVSAHGEQKGRSAAYEGLTRSTTGVAVHAFHLLVRKKFGAVTPFLSVCPAPGVCQAPGAKKPCKKTPPPGFGRTEAKHLLSVCKRGAAGFSPQRRRSPAARRSSAPRCKSRRTGPQGSCR